MTLNSFSPVHLRIYIHNSEAESIRIRKKKMLFTEIFYPASTVRILAGGSDSFLSLRSFQQRK